MSFKKNLIAGTLAASEALTTACTPVKPERPPEIAITQFITHEDIVVLLKKALAEEAIQNEVKPAELYPQFKEDTPEDRYIPLDNMSEAEKQQITAYFELKRKKMCEAITQKEHRPLLEKVLQTNPQLLYELGNITGVLYKIIGRPELPNKKSSILQKIGCEKASFVTASSLKTPGLLIYTLQDLTFLHKVVLGLIAKEAKEKAQ